MNGTFLTVLNKLEAAFLIPFLSSVISELINSLVFTDSENVDLSKKEVNKACQIVFNIILRVGIYFLAIIFAAFFYSIIKYAMYKIDVLSTFDSLISYITIRYWIELLLVPFIIRGLTFLITKRIKTRTIARFFQIMVILACFIALVFTPFLIERETNSPFPIEQSVLAEIKRTPFQFQTKICDIDHFIKQETKGYTIENEKGLVSNSINDELIDENEPQDIEEKSIDEMSFVELVYYINDYLSNAEKCESALNKAIELFNIDQYDSSDDQTIGLFFYFYAYLKGDTNYYYKAIDKFEIVSDFYMIGQSYRLIGSAENNQELYERAIYYYQSAWSESEISIYAWQIANLKYILYKDYGYDSLGSAIEYYILSVKCNDDHKSTVEESKDSLISIFSSLYKTGKITKYIDQLKLLCSTLPDDAFFNTLNVTYNISQGNQTEADVQKINHLLAFERYANCPKLLLMKAYFLYSDSSSSSSEYRSLCDKVLDIYTYQQEKENHVSYFEPEDFINLAWLFYMDGDYVKAYRFAAEQKNTDGLQNDAALLMAESYLSESKSFSEIDQNKLYNDVKTRVDTFDDNSDNDVFLRLRIVNGLFEYRLGIDKSLSGLSNACFKLFGDRNLNSIFIGAFLKYSDGTYEECVALCNQMLEEYESNDYSYHRILFLKADALMMLAKRASSGEELQAYCDEAEKALIIVQNAVEDDYITSLQKLHSLYKMMENRDADLQEINDKLNVLN